ncbi:LPS export ABC transporter ATP-binding protein [Mariprofundus sp. NF]|uniref:LPS export ABC transporter ATP-binding protein n=1 Tax=Mariprofundus sp. NF TaxID=2608716 RepID=UPI0015A20EC9|nr:LPS export ABC transporter ATP-binding protein [Mariprofundus sp. NF]NWF39701.1 LPS export ABC transporter ATP-binding protein [Mariprofundus sp. NF]
MSTVHHLSARGLCKSYRKKQVVSEVDIDLFSGECIGLLGPNGAGKTTSFYMVCGLITADSGQVSLDDLDITRQPMHLRARSGIGYLPQEASIFRKLTVAENLLAIFETLNMPDIQVAEELEHLLIDLGIEGVKDQKAYTLSGGQRRRTEIARALVTKPRFLLLDEPFAGVDPIAVEDIQAIIAELKSKGIGVLITDHNVRDTLSICDRAYLMSAGEIIVHGTSDEIIAHPDARRLYLGESFSM